jgi:hypothetical protein
MVVMVDTEFEFCGELLILIVLYCLLKDLIVFYETSSSLSSFDLRFCIVMKRKKPPIQLGFVASTVFSFVTSKRANAKLPKETTDFDEIWGSHFLASVFDGVQKAVGVATLSTS